MCSECGPRLLQGGQCGLCKARKVSAKPIGRSLPPELLDLFRPFSKQDSLQSRARKEKFRSKHISRAMKLHSKLEKVHQKKEEDMKKNDEEFRKLEKRVEEKKKKMKLMEDDINKLEEKANKASAVAVGRARKKKENHPEPKRAVQTTFTFSVFSGFFSVE